MLDRTQQVVEGDGSLTCVCNWILMNLRLESDLAFRKLSRKRLAVEENFRKMNILKRYFE